MTRRSALQVASALALGMTAVSPAAAQELPSPVTQIVEAAPPSTQWVICYVWDRAADKKWVSGIFEAPAARVRHGWDYGWVQHVKSQFTPSRDTVGGCTIEDTREDAEWRHAVFTDEDPAHPGGLVEVADWSPDFSRVPLAPVRAAPVAVASAAPPPPPPRFVVETAALIPALLPRQALVESAPSATHSEAEFQRKMAEYERQLADQQRQVDAYREAQAEIAQRKSRQALAAANAEAEYARQMQAHQAVLRRHDAEVAKYEAELGTPKTSARR